MLVRLPRQPGGGATIDKEARWLPFVGSRVTCAVPRVLGIGEPDLGYSERWAVTQRLDGVSVRPPLPGSGDSAPAGLAKDPPTGLRWRKRQSLPPEIGARRAAYHPLPAARRSQA